MDFKKMYAYLLGAVDDALTLMESGCFDSAYQVLLIACETCEEEYIKTAPNEEALHQMSTNSMD